MEDHPKCTVTGCDGVAVPGYNGRCQTCHQQLSEVTVNNVSRKLEGLNVRPNPVCLTLGCGNPSTNVNGFCLHCYLSQVDCEGKVATFQECVATGCKESGYRKLQGFCRRCFSASQIMDLSVLRKSSVEKGQQLCRTPNCEFYGLEEQNGQCSCCFKDFLDRKSKSLSDSFESTRKSLTTGKSSAMNPGIKDSNYSKNRLTIAPLDVYEPINSDELFGSGPDEGKQTEFTVSKHDCKQLCGRKCVAQCDPYCMTCWEALKLQPAEQQARLTQHPQSDVQPACNPSSSMAGCKKPVSNLTLPLLPGSKEQGYGTKASPMSHDESQQGKNPESPPSETRSRKGIITRNELLPENSTQKGSDSLNMWGDPADCERPVRKQIRLKFIPQDKADFNQVCISGVIICLWNKHNIDNGTHPLFEKIGEVVKTSDLENFRTCLQHDQVATTKGGTSAAACVVHCKYHPVTMRQVARALVRCLEFVETRKEKKTIFPVMFSDDLCDNPDVVIRATLYAISNTQKSTNYTQNLDKFYLYVADESIATQCKKKYREILADKESRQRSQSRRQKCHTCKTNPAAKLKPLSGSCKDECAVFCIQCLQQGRQNQLLCPNHGPCFSPIGHQNTFALLVAGYDKSEDVAKLFVADVQDMEKTLMHESVIGIRKENIQVIQTDTPAKKDDMKTKLMDAFKYTRDRLRKDKDHARFYFYYSGHNTETELKFGDRTNDITPKELKEELKKLHVESIIIILDCCYSEGVNVIPDDHGEDFTSFGSCSKDDSESFSYIPKLWNLESSDDCGDKGDERKVYQWSSSKRKEKSSYSRKKGSSLFTLSIVKAMMGLCPLEDDACPKCKEFEREVRNDDGVFLEAISATVCYHVNKLASNIDKIQNPSLDSKNDDILLSFHTFP